MQKNNFFIIIIAFIVFIIQAEALAIIGPRKIAVINETLYEKVPLKSLPIPLKSTSSDNNINDLSKSSGTSILDVRKFKKVIVINGKARSETTQSPNGPVVSPEIKESSIKFQSAVESEKKDLAAKEAKL